MHRQSLFTAEAEKEYLDFHVIVKDLKQFMQKYNLKDKNIHFSIEDQAKNEIIIYTKITPSKMKEIAQNYNRDQTKAIDSNIVRIEHNDGHLSQLKNRI